MVPNWFNTKNKYPRETIEYSLLSKSEDPSVKYNPSPNIVKIIITYYDKK